MQTGSEGGENFVSSTGGVTTTHGTYVEKVNRCNSGGRTGKREREKKRSIDHDKRGGREGGERVLQVQDTLISPTGGFYRLQPPSDTRLVVKISDAPWAGERGRAVNRCRLIEHIHVRRAVSPLLYPRTHNFLHRSISIHEFLLRSSCREDVNPPPSPCSSSSSLRKSTSNRATRTLGHSFTGRTDVNYTSRAGQGGAWWNRCAHLSLPACVHTPKEV